MPWVQVSSAYLKQIEWKSSNHLVPYQEALAFMESRVQAIIEGRAGPCIWFLEHPPLYTAGTSADKADILDPDKFPVFEAGRGGEYTYHGPGQLIAYCMLDLKQLFAPSPPDLRAYIKLLEGWIIETLAGLGIKGEVREGRVGVWVHSTQRTVDSGQEHYQPMSTTHCPMPTANEAKIAAIGVRVRKWVAFHGISINVSPDLTHYAGIVPCGIKEYGVTSLKQLNVQISVSQLAESLQRQSEALGNLP